MLFFDKKIHLGLVMPKNSIPEIIFQMISTITGKVLSERMFFRKNKIVGFSV